MVDVTKKEDWETLWATAEKFFEKKIDVLVNNAGVSPLLGFDLCMKVRYPALGTCYSALLCLLDKPGWSTSWLQHL